MLRRRLYKLHKWVGLLTGLLMLAVTLSGIPLLFRASVDRWSRPAAFHIHPAGQQVEINSFMARAQHEYPAASLVALELNTPADEPIRLAMRDASGSFTVFIQPYSGQILSDSRSAVPLSATLYQLHTSLFLGRIGSIVTTLLGLAIVFLAFTGVYVYRAAWRNPFWMRRGKRHGRGFNLASFHRLTGLWALLFLLMTGATGFWLNHESLMPSEEGTNIHKFDMQSIKDLRLLIRDSTTRLPGFHPVSLVFADDGTDVIEIYGSLGSGPLSFIYGLYASKVTLGGRTATVLDISTPYSQSMRDRIINLVYPVHSADFALGESLPIIRSLYAVAGLVPGLLFVTGFVMTRHRFRRTTKSNSSTSVLLTP